MLWVTIVLQYIDIWYPYSKQTHCWSLKKAAAKIKLKVEPTTLLLLFFAL